MSIELLRQRLAEGGSVAPAVLESALAEIDTLKARLTEAEKECTHWKGVAGSVIVEQESATEDALHLIDQIGQMEVRAIEAERRAEAATTQNFEHAKEAIIDTITLSLEGKIAQAYRERNLAEARAKAWSEENQGLRDQLAEADAALVPALERAERAEKQVADAEAQAETLRGMVIREGGKIRSFRAALEEYAKEEHWTYYAGDANEFWAWLGDLGVSPCLFAQTALLAPQERGAEGYKRLAERLWEKVNARRCELIQWDVAWLTNDQQQAELAELQALADEYIHVMAPLPIAELEAYAAALDAPEEAGKAEGGEA